MEPLVQIFTPRLIIRPPTLDDLDAIHAAKEAVWVELQKWMSWSSDDQVGYDATKAFIEARGMTQDPCDTCLIAVTKETSEFVLSAGLDRKHDIKNQHVSEIGYWNAPGYLRQGFASEATSAILRYAFDACAVDKVVISHAINNIPSRCIIEKMGFSYTHTKKDAHINHHDATREDMLYYEMLHTDKAKIPKLDVSWAIH